ncbi:MAG: SPOR domain-containing protein, partial [Pseudomonadota bacterium]
FRRSAPGPRAGGRGRWRWRRGGTSRPETVSRPRSSAPGAGSLPPGDYIQVGSFRRAANANALARRLEGRGQNAEIVRVTIDGKRYSVVMVGPLAGPAAIAAASSAAAEEGLVDAIMVKI